MQHLLTVCALAAQEFRLIGSWIPLAAQFGESDVHEVSDTAIDLGNSWSGALSSSLVDRSNSKYYYNGTRLTCDPALGPDTPAPPVELLAAQANDLLLFRSSLAFNKAAAAAPAAAAMPAAPAMPAAAPAPSAAACLDRLPDPVRLNAGTTSELLLLAGLKDPCHMEISLTGPDMCVLSCCVYLAWHLDLGSSMVLRCSWCPWTWT